MCEERFIANADSSLIEIFDHICLIFILGSIRIIRKDRIQGKTLRECIEVLEESRSKRYNSTERISSTNNIRSIT